MNRTHLSYLIIILALATSLVVLALKKTACTGCGSVPLMSIENFREISKRIFPHEEYDGSVGSNGIYPTGVTMHARYELRIPDKEPLLELHAYENFIKLAEPGNSNERWRGHDTGESRFYRQITMENENRSITITAMCLKNNQVIVNYREMLRCVQVDNKGHW